MWDFLTSKSSCYSCNAFCLLLLCLAQLLLASDYSLNVCLNKYQYWIIQSAELFILFAFLQQSTILLVFVVLRSFDSSFRKWARQLFQQVLGLFSVHQLCQSKGTCSDFSHVWIVEEPIIQIYVLYLGQSCCAYTIATADWPRTHAPQQTGRYGASHMICLRNYCWEVADKFSLQRWDPE